MSSPLIKLQAENSDLRIEIERLRAECMERAVRQKQAEERLAKVVEALRVARDFARTERDIFANPNFTDRYGDADRCECPVCNGSGRTDNHVTGEVEFGACDGSGAAQPEEKK